MPKKTIFRNGIKWLILISIVFLLLFIILFPGLELFLRTGIFDDLSPIWIPDKYHHINSTINIENEENSLNNPYFFNDHIREKEKPEGVFRIVLLGDSFVWGDGLPYGQAWGHQLERKARRLNPDIEVFNWGLRGWSTYNQFRFIQYGIEYDIDLLIIPFVYNDTDDGTIWRKELEWHEGEKWYNNFIISPLSKVFPNASGFLISHINAFLCDFIYTEYGYKAWHDKLYCEDSLVKYQELLFELSAFLKEHEVPLLFVLTPNTHEEFNKRYFDKIIPLLDNASIEYMNLYPVIAREFADYKPRELWANPANAHPGKIVMKFYAREVLAYLRRNDLIPYTQRLRPLLR